MRNGEGGNKLQHFDYDKLECAIRRVRQRLASAKQWNQQCEQEQQMIVTCPDMPDAFVNKRQHIRQRRLLVIRATETLLPRRKYEYRGSIACLQLHQSTMRRVAREQ